MVSVKTRAVKSRVAEARQKRKELGRLQHSAAAPGVTLVQAQ
jgi:hypothetical protein